MSYTRTTWENGTTPLNATNMNNIEDGIEEAFSRISGLIDIFYPVGSYYETSNASFDPNNEWGGTWSLETAGKVHIGAGTGYAIGSTGGNKDAIIPYHRHSVSAQTSGTPSTDTSGGMSAHSSHTHALKGGAGTGTSDYPTLAYTYSGSTTGDNSMYSADLSHTHSLGNHTHSVPAHNTDYVGTSGNVTDANMQPYIVVNRWHRTA